MTTAIAAPVILDPRGGLGDNIYGRPAVRAYVESGEDVIVRTPWPQLFSDLDVRFQQPGGMGLRTQQKNMARMTPDTWTAEFYIRGATTKVFVYRLEVPGRTILGEIEAVAGWPDGAGFRFDLPSFPWSGLSVARDSPIAVVRPVSERREWPNRARNPDARYITRACQLLRDAGFHVVTVADIDGRHENAVGPLPQADKELVRGEMGVEDLLALVEHADIVVGGPGWIVPATMAYGTPAVIIGGGNGGHNAPDLLTDPRVDCSRMRFILPDHYCHRCTNMRHGCMKVISDFDARFTDALAEVAYVA